VKSGDPELLDVPDRMLLMTDGRGDPNDSKDFQQATEALFSVSYWLRFHLNQPAVAVAASSISFVNRVA
jgi:hypothetical protein